VPEVLAIVIPGGPRDSGAAALGTAAAAAPAISQTARLTRRLAAGDEAAFGEFHQQYFDRLYRHILVLARGDETAAKEALQETLCRVARYVRQFDRETVFWCWLTALARSAVCDGGRRRRRYWLLLQSYAQRWLPLLVEANTEQESRLHSALEACLLALPSEDRALVERKYLANQTMRELAAQTGLTERAVESRLLRLRRQLREQMLRKLRDIDL